MSTVRKVLQIRVRGGLAGFSLLEVLLASMIFSTVIGGLAMTWRYHERSLQKYRNRNAARTILNQELERITAHNYVNLEEAGGSLTAPLVVPLIRSVDSVDVQKDFTLNSTVTENANQSLKDVVVTVEFEERDEIRSLTVRTRAFRSQ